MKYQFKDEGLNFSLLLDPVEESLKELKISAAKAAESKVSQTSSLALECQSQIKAYLRGELKEFSLPLAPQGTAFQLKVWDQLSQIPYGETLSYKDVAVRLGQVKAYQAVGQANGANPIPLIIPCHRVVTHKKGLGGYALGLRLKKYFLDLEGVKL